MMNHKILIINLNYHEICNYPHLLDLVEWSLPEKCVLFGPHVETALWSHVGSGL